MRCQRTSRCGF
jgi:hypothetical protein